MGLARLVRRPGPGAKAATRPATWRSWPATRAARNQVGRRLGLQALEERLVSAVVLKPEEVPAGRHQEPGGRPADLARLDRQPEAHREPNHQGRRVVHQVVEIDSGEASRSPPPGDLAVNVVEPVAELGQQGPGHEARPCSPGQGQGRRQVRQDRQGRDLMRREAEPDRQPGSEEGRRPDDLSREEVADLDLGALRSCRAEAGRPLVGACPEFHQGRSVFPANQSHWRWSLGP